MSLEGTVIGGKYRLEGPIDQGGMATIWKATHLDLHHPVAVKFLRLRGPDPAREAGRSLREARMAARVRHRNVVDIIDVGQTDNDVPYIVMEYLEGESLASLLGKGPVPLGELLKLMTQTLSGLGAVHDVGLVHRDLKPENIFLVRDADGQYPKIIDFGISRAVGKEPGRKEAPTTDEGLVIGTPHYISPEQARGVRDLDARTDIYSMGVILYEAITGRVPFDVDQPLQLLVKLNTEAPRSVHELRPDVATEVANLVTRAMARNRNHRFPDARAMRDALVEASELVEGALSRPRGMLVKEPTVDVATIVFEALSTQYREVTPVLDPADLGVDPHAATLAVDLPTEPPKLVAGGSRRRIPPAALIGGAIAGAVLAIAVPLALTGDTTPASDEVVPLAITPSGSGIAVPSAERASGFEAPPGEEHAPGGAPAAGEPAGTSEDAETSPGPAVAEASSPEKKSIADEPGTADVPPKPVQARAPEPRPSEAHGPPPGDSPGTRAAPRRDTGATRRPRRTRAPASSTDTARQPRIITTL